MGTRDMTTAVQTYLIHFRDRELALAVGAALEGRMAADGREAVALVPAGDGLGLTRADGGGRGAGRGSYGAAPQVVALYEDGLLDRLEALGLTAYIGIGPGQEPGVFRWGDGGAMLLPVATARELVAAVADRTPWADHAARMTPFDTLPREPGGPRLTRTLVAAGVAGPLLLAGLPATALAATAHPASTAVTAVDTSLTTAKTTQLPPGTRAFLNRLENYLRYYLEEIRATTTTTGNASTQALQNEITRLLNQLATRQTGTTQTAPQQGGGSSGGGQAPSNGGSQGGGSGGQQGSGQGQQGQGQSGSRGTVTGQSGQGQSGSGMGTTSSGSPSGSGMGSSAGGTSNSGGGYSGGGSSGGGSGSG
jgi:hypothetical protein